MYEHFFNSGDDIRIGDAERDQTAEQLRTAHGEGRLDAEELQERIDRCLKAKTMRELRELVADLPDQREAKRNVMGTRYGLWRLVSPLPLLLLIVALGAVQAHGLFALVIVFFLVRFLLYTRGRGRWARSC